MGLKSTKTAIWDISLYTECPKCDTSYDILDQHPDILQTIRPIENGTNRTTGFETICPECSHEFEVDFEY
jgi:hypothetical protein